MTEWQLDAPPATAKRMKMVDETKQKKPIGRPTKYTKKLSDEICAQIALGHSLRTICRDESMPSVVTIFSWLRIDPEFLKQYEKAKEDQSDALAEEMLDIADDGTNDWMLKQNKDGSEYVALNSEHVQRSRLRVDTRKWIASKLKPKKYGDKAAVDLTSNGQTLSALIESSMKSTTNGD